MKVLFEASIYCLLNMKIFILFAILFLNIPHLCKSQKKIQFGLGLNREVTFIDGENQLFIGDSIFFENDEIVRNPLSLNGPVRADPRLQLFLGYTIVDNNRLNANVSLFFDKKWTTLFLIRLFDDPQPPFAGIVYTPYITRTTFFFPLQLEYSPFESTKINTGLIRNLELKGGMGPSFHVGSNAQRIDYDLGLSNDRKDPIYYETWYQFQKNAYKIITWNYTWSVSTKIYKSLGIQLTSNGNFGSVTKPIEVFGEKYRIPIKRRSAVLFLTYEFNLLLKGN